jgi:uncharacterized protein
VALGCAVEPTRVSHSRSSIAATLLHSAVLSTSRYNFSVIADGVAALFNARSGALVRLAGDDGIELAQTLCRWPLHVDPEIMPASILSILTKGAFLIATDADELAAIARTFREARDEAPIVLTITTTMDCNLGCYYCYEDRTNDRLEMTDVAQIVSLAAKRLADSQSGSLHVDWYGGEPMLNAEFIEACSLELQALCAQQGAAYHASIISNGTAWPSDPGAFVVRHKIRQAQISFDGLERNHNKRRRFRKGRTSPGTSSFRSAWDLVTALLDFVRVDVRYNMDGGNLGDVIPFIDRAERSGWFSRTYPAVFQPARLTSYSKRSEFMRDVALTPDEYDRIRGRIRGRAAGRFLVEESEAPDGIPVPRTSVCAALARHSDVVGADRQLYRCGLQVGERGRATAALQSDAVGSDAIFWRDYDPTHRPQCAHCSFLPLCMGGCPKKHLEDDTESLSEQSRYWRHNLPRLIANASGLAADLRPFDEGEQFRDGYRPPPVRRRHLPVV